MITLTRTVHVHYLTKWCNNANNQALR